MKKYNIYVYGAGNVYNQLANSFHHCKELNILGIVTTTRSFYKKIDGYDCFGVDEINDSLADFFIIAVENWKEIFNILIHKGIKESKIIRGKVFQLPDFDFSEYIELKKSNISILSNYCLGGMIYKKLGLKMNSPTIDMYCSGKQYLEFLERYEYYMSCEMQEFEWENYVDGMQSREAFYLKGILGNRIIWNFNHSLSIENTIAQWNKRKMRFNYSNVAAIMTIQCDEDAIQFEHLKIEKKLGIYYRDLKLEHVIYIPEWWNNPQMILKYDGNWICFVNRYMSDSGGHVSPINWIKFLLGYKSYKRKIPL